MWKHLAALLILFMLIKYSHGLDCYVTDLQKIKSGDAKKSYTLQSCRSYILKALQKEGKSGKLPPDIEFNCYTLFVVTEATDVRVKGCVPKDNCGFVQTRVKNESFGKVKNITYTECSTDKCNSNEIPSAISSRTTDQDSGSIRCSISFIIATILLLLVALI